MNGFVLILAIVGCSCAVNLVDLTKKEWISYKVSLTKRNPQNPQKMNFENWIHLQALQSKTYSS